METSASGTRRIAWSVSACEYSRSIRWKRMLVLTLSSIGLCGVYYWLWIYILPKYGKYAIRQTRLVLDDVSMRLSKRHDRRS